MQFTIPEDGIVAGQAFGFGSDSPFFENWELEEGSNFELDTEGDQVFIYCLDADNVPNFLWGYSYNGPWADSGLPDADYGTDKSALPTSIENIGNLALEHNDNCVYDGVLAGRKTELQRQFMDPTLFTCLNDLRIELATNVQPSASAMTTSTLSLIMTGAMALAGFVAVMTL